jgi:hypothetical protein
MRGTGRAVFVAVLLLIAGTLNIIYGIGAVGNAHFFANTQYLFSSLHTWGWITIIVGIIQLTAGFSLFAGDGYGRVIGIFAASIGALESLLSIGGTHPWWSLAIFALCVYMLHGLIVFGEDLSTAPQLQSLVESHSRGRRATQHLAGESTFATGKHCSRARRDSVTIAHRKRPSRPAIGRGCYRRTAKRGEFRLSRLVCTCPAFPAPLVSPDSERPGSGGTEAVLNLAL